ncbi:hypothetical protein [Aeoliella sp.]|uniref:hypothetical protein n=1 Tax=Aeoliella sp. TaxID=2795800 RepID=UPI003CCBAAB1
MTENPYQPPASAPSSATDESQRETMARPVGVTILAILHFIGGVVLLIAQFLLFTNLETIGGNLRFVGVSPLLLVIGLMFLAILTIASGVGMWMGTKWGWWLATFYYVYSIFRNGAALFTIMVMMDQLEGGSRGPEYYVVKHGVRVIVHFLLFLYFFQGNVLDFFGLRALSKPKAVGILVGVCIAISVAMSAIGVLLS